METATPPDLLDELRSLEAELHHPGLPADIGRLEQLLHPDFHEVGRSGQRYTRATVVAFLASQATPTALAASGHALHHLAEGCALLTYQSHHDAGPGRAPSLALRSSVWLHTPAGWQLFYHQGTPVPDSGTAGA